MNYFAISYIFVSAVPGLWLAAQKNFLIIPNRNYDIFPVRFLFMPSFSVFVLLLSYLLDFFIAAAFPELYQTLPERFGIYIGLLEPLSVSLVMISAIRLFVLRKDLPPEKDPDFMNYDLYVYQPLIKITAPGILKQNCLDIDTIDTVSVSTLRVMKAKDYFRDKEAIKRLDILLTRDEMIASPRAVNLFSAYGLTGFEASPITVKGLGGDEDFYGPFYRIRSLHKMPHMAPPTIIKKTLISSDMWIVDDLIYYDSDTISSAADFNESLESIGNADVPYLSQPLQIVSNRVMKLFIDEFRQHRGDFIPVHCDTEAGTKRKTDPSTNKL